WRINVKGVSGDPVAYAALVAVQKISGHNFVVVVCGMSESSSSVAITQRINAGRIRAKLIINLDVTALIDFNPGMLQTEVVGVRHTTDCEKRMRADDSLISAAALNLNGHFVAAFM